MLAKCAFDGLHFLSSLKKKKPSRDDTLESVAYRARLFNSLVATHNSELLSDVKLAWK